MTNKHKFHYVYRITNVVEKKYYYGKRSSSISPKLDIGFKYFSSSKNEKFQKDQKINPQNYKYKIVAAFRTVEEAIKREIRLHKLFLVGRNPSFYNLITQVSNGFDSTGRFLAENSEGHRIYTCKDDPDFISGEYKTVKFGFTLKGREFSDEHKLNLSKSLKGIKKSNTHSKNISKSSIENGVTKGENHPRFKYYYHTPWGIFDSPKALEPEFTMSKMKKFCIQNTRKIQSNIYKNCTKLQESFGVDCINKTYKELGFYIIPKEEYENYINKV